MTDAQREDYKKICKGMSMNTSAEFVKFCEHTFGLDIADDDSRWSETQAAAAMNWLKERRATAKAHTSR
jgi:hypothetical protein